MSKFEYKAKVEALRKRGYSLKQIVDETKLSKSTISLWCRDIILSNKQQRLLQKKMIEGGHKGRLLGALTNKKKKQDAKEDAARWAESFLSRMSEDAFALVGVALYWAEGSKSDKHQLSFINSDPQMILFMYHWLQKIFNLRPTDFIVRISVNETHRPRIDTILNYWSNLLELPKVAFKKTTFIKTRLRKVYMNHDNYFGLISLRIRKSSVIKYRIFSLVEYLRNAGVAQVVRASHS